MQKHHLGGGMNPKIEPKMLQEMEGEHELQKLQDFTTSYSRIITGDTSKKKGLYNPMSIDKNDNYI